MKDLFLSVMGLLKSSPPQLRRGEPRCKRGWGGVGREIDSFDQHHPGDLLIDASRYRARPSGRHPSSAEEGCFYHHCLLFVLFVALVMSLGVQHVWGQRPPTVPLPQAVSLPPNMTLTTRLDRTAVWVGDQFHYMIIVEYPADYEFVL